MQDAKTRLGQTSGPFCFPASPAEGNAPSWETVMKVNVYLSEREAIRAGVNGGMHSVEVDGAALSQAERDYLAKSLKTSSDGCEHLVGPKAPTAEALLVWLRWEMAAVAKETAAKAAALAARTAAWLDCPDEKLIETTTSGVVRVATGWAAWGPDAGAYSTNSIDESVPGVKEKLARLKDNASRIQARLAAEHAALQARRQADKDAAEKAMLDWAKTHGSELLRERVAGEYNWKSLARREYAASVAAGIGAGWMPEPEPWNCNGWDNPTLDAIKAKKAVLAAVPAVKDGPGLRTCIVMLVTVETDDGEDTFPGLRISVACPDGELVSLVRKLD